MRLQEMSVEELKREFLLKPQNDVVWRILKRSIVNEAIVATINLEDGTVTTSNVLPLCTYVIVRLKESGEVEPPKFINPYYPREVS